jgi:hypothetical protein
MHMEWRSEYEINILDSSSDSQLSIQVDAPFWSFSKCGLFKHFDTIVSGRTIQIVPRFLFGLPVDIIETLYQPADNKEDLENDIVANLPMAGFFSESPLYDRIIIQTYMNIITLTVIFVLYSNNPPGTVAAKHSSTNSSPAKKKAKKIVTPTKQIAATKEPTVVDQANN